jgi:Fic family protein
VSRFKKSSIPYRQLIHESNLISGINDKVHDAIGIVAFRIVIRHWPAINYERIMELHRLVTIFDPIEDHYRGRIRDFRKEVNGRPVMSPKNIESGLHEWVRYLTYRYKKIPYKEMHNRFMLIHPFSTGNGRIGRILMWYHQIRKLKMLPYPLTYDNREEYFKWWL